MAANFDHLNLDRAFIENGRARFTEQGDRLTPFAPWEVQMRETLTAMLDALDAQITPAHAA
jgi:hypothetical protein